MLYSRRGDTYVIRFEEDEVFPDRFLDFLSSELIGGGHFSGLGALARTRIAFFDVEKREYLDRDFDEQLEVLSLTGNVAMHDGGPLVHAHVTLGRRDYSVVGGHLRRGIVRPTLEVTLRTVSGLLQRSVDPAYGLPAFDLDNRF